MFWKFGFHTQSAIDAILDRESYTLQELLDEDEILQESKSSNKRLLDFLTQPENMETLIRYATVTPAEDCNEMERFKYPNIAAEILSSDVNVICELLCTNEKYVEMLWNFLNQDGEFNPLMASFFSKIVGMLINKHPAETFRYIREKEGVIERILDHLGTPAIMDILMRIIAKQDEPVGAEMLQWLCEQDVPVKIVHMFDKTQPESVHQNAAQALAEIVVTCNDAADPDNKQPNAMVDKIQSPELLMSLMNYMFADCPSALSSGCAFLLSLLADPVVEIPFEEDEAARAPPKKKISLVDKNAVVQIISMYLSDFHKVLLARPPVQPIETTVGRLEEPFGQLRLRVLRLIASVVRANQVDVNSTIVNENMLQTFVDLFFKYPWNNFVHAQVEKIICTIVQNHVLSISEGGQNETQNGVTKLMEVLFKDVKLTERILEAYKLNKENEEAKLPRLGYMGHLTNIANVIFEATKEDEIRDVTGSFSDGWETFTKSSLADANSRNQQTLGGQRPMNTSDESGDEDLFHNLPSNPETAFTAYLSQRLNVAPMPDNYMADEDEESPTGMFSGLGSSHLSSFNRMRQTDPTPVEDSEWHDHNIVEMETSPQGADNAEDSDDEEDDDDSDDGVTHSYDVAAANNNNSASFAHWDAVENQDPFASTSEEGSASDSNWAHFATEEGSSVASKPDFTYMEVDDAEVPAEVQEAASMDIEDDIDAIVAQADAEAAAMSEGGNEEGDDESAPEGETEDGQRGDEDEAEAEEEGMDVPSALSGPVVKSKNKSIVRRPTPQVRPRPPMPTRGTDAETAEIVQEEEESEEEKQTQESQTQEPAIAEQPNAAGSLTFAEAAASAPTEAEVDANADANATASAQGYVGVEAPVQGDSEC